MAEVKKRQVDAATGEEADQLVKEIIDLLIGHSAYAGIAATAEALLATSLELERNLPTAALVARKNLDERILVHQQREES